MNNPQEFSTTVIEKLKHYVYILIDPEDGTPFYVGKGVGNRVFHHAQNVLDSASESDKILKIKSIIDKGKQVKYVIARHGMKDSSIAFEVEAALIDFIGMSSLTNIVSGHYSSDYGLQSVDEIIQRYEAPKIPLGTIKEPSVFIIINREYRRLCDECSLRQLGNTEEELVNQDSYFNQKLYEVTRSSWVIGAKRDKAKYAFAICDGIVREIYEIDDKWKVEGELKKRGTRYEFIGHIANDWEKYSEYLGSNVKEYITKGSQNPILYVGNY